MTGRLLVVSLLTLALAACGPPPRPRSGPLEPPLLPRHKPTPPAGLEGLAPAPAAGAAGEIARPASIVVQAGDTVYGIARRYALPIRSLIDANELKPPFVLRLGRSLRIPSPRVHKVAAGDTVYGISRRYQVDMAALMRQNRIVPPFRIRVGQLLVLPGGEAPRTAVAAVTSEPLPVPAPVRRPMAEQLAALAADEGVVIPRPRPGRASRISAPPPPSLPQSAAIPKAPPLSGGRFLWPLRGKLISTYGPKGGGRHNDGINIAAPRGTEVLAAENGVVAYAGNELRGFGRLLLIKHAGGWVTAYAHNERLLVGRGQQVRRGQPIALVGSSGNVSTPQLHFEVRKGTRAIDPAEVLGPRQTAIRG